MMQRNIKNNSGFTLVETLVVIILLSVLALVVFNYIDVVYYLNKASDTKRITDMRNLYDTIQREVIEGKITLKSTNNTYLSSIEQRNPSNGTGYMSFEVRGGQVNYRLGDMPQLPKDPRQGQNFNYFAFPISGNELLPVSVNNSRYIYCSDGNKFKIATVLEADEKGVNENKMKNDSGTLSHWYEVGSDLSLCAGVRP